MIPCFDTALSLLKAHPDPEGKIIGSSAYWIPVQMMYVELVRLGEIARLSDLPGVDKEKYWRRVRGEDWPQWKKISVCQALYLFDLITK